MAETEFSEAAHSSDGASSPSQPSGSKDSTLESVDRSSTVAGRRSVSATSTPSTAATGRRPGTSATSSGPKTSSTTTAPGARTAGGMTKPPTRPPASSVRRPATSTSTSSHRSRPSVSASEDEKKSIASSIGARRTSSLMSTPSKGGDKTGTVASTTTVRKSIGGAGAASPRVTGIASRNANAAASASTTRAGPTRPTGTAPGGAADARKRLSTAGTAATISRPATRTSLRSEAPTDVAKMVMELTAKLDEKDAQIESLKSEISSFEKTILELREQANNEASDHRVGEEASQQERDEFLASLKAEHGSAVQTLEARLSETTDKLHAAERDLAEAVRGKEEGEAALKALQKSLESLQLEYDEKLRVNEGTLANALQDHAAQIEKMQSSAADQERSEAALAELNSKHESVVADLQRKIDELTASNASLESSSNDRLKSEQGEHISAIAALEGEVSELKVKLKASEESVERGRVEMESEKASALKLIDTLSEKEAELASAHEALATTQKKLNDAQTVVDDKDGEIAKLKTMHDERMKQISQDYENEIESLRGDAFFKRKFEELEKQHNDLKASTAEAADAFAKALAASNEEHSQAVSALQQKLDDLHHSHANELLEVTNSSASSIKEAHAKELDALKTHHAEQLEMVAKDGDAKLARHLEGLRASNEHAIDDLKRTNDDERERLLAAHQSELTAASDAADALNALQAVELDKLKVELDKAKVELEKAQHSNAEELAVLKRQLHESHAADVEQLIEMNTEAMESLKAEGAQAKKDLQELAAAHTKTIEDVLADYRHKQAKFEQDLSQQAVTNADLQATLETAQESLAQAQAEVQDISQQLAHEKMERMTALAELDAVKNIKPDTAANDALKAELVTTKRTLEESLFAAQRDLQAKQEELDSCKSDLTAVQEKLVSVGGELEVTQKSFEAQAKQETAQADYRDLNDSMTALVEEASNKARELEDKVEELTKKVEDGAKRTDELQAQLKVRDAELAEAKARAAAAKPKGLASSRFARADDNEDDAAAEGNAAEGEDEDDHSSVALALLSKARLTAKQADALDREMRDRNLQLLSSITDVNLSG